MKFTYQPSFSFFYPVLLAIGGFMAFYGATNEFDLAYRRLTLLTAPYSSYALMAAGALLILWGLYSIVQWMSNRGKGGEIILSDSGLSFPDYAMTGSTDKTLAYGDISEVYINEGDEFSLIIHTDNDRFEFDSTLFSGEDAYNTFCQEILKRKPLTSDN